MSNKYISLEHTIKQVVRNKSPGVNFNESIIGNSSQSVGTPSAFLRPVTKDRRLGLDTARTAASQRMAAPQATFEGGKPAVTPNYGNVSSVADLSARGASEGGKNGKKLREANEDKDENTNLDLIKRKGKDGINPEPVRFKSGLELEMEKAGMPKPSLSFQPSPPTPEQTGSPPPQAAPPQSSQPPIEQGASPQYGSMNRYTNPASTVVPPADMQAIEQGQPPVSAPASTPQSIPPKEQSIGDTIRQKLQNPGVGLPTVAGLAGAAGMGGASADVLGGAAEVLPRFGWPGAAALAGTAAAIYGGQKIRDYMSEPSQSDFSQFQQAAPAQSATQAAGIPKERPAPPATTQQWLDVKPHLDSQRTMGHGVTQPTQRVGDVASALQQQARGFTASPEEALARSGAFSAPGAQPAQASALQTQNIPLGPAKALASDEAMARSGNISGSAPAQAASIIDQQARAMPRQQTGMSPGSAIPAGAAAVGISPKDNINQGKFTSSAPASIPMPGIENQKRAGVQSQFTSTADPASAAGIAPNITSARALPSSKTQDKFTSAAPAAAQPYKMDSAQQQPFTSKAPNQAASIIDQQARVLPRQQTGMSSGSAIPAGAAAAGIAPNINSKRAGVQSNFTSTVDPSGAQPVGIAPNITSAHALPTSKRDQVTSGATPAGAQAVGIPPSLVSPRDPAAKRQQDAFTSGIPNAAIQPAIETQRRAISPTDPSVSAASMQKPAIDNSIAAPAKFAVTPPITSPAVQSASSMIDQQARAIPKTHAPEAMNADNPTAAGIAPNITSPHALPTSKKDQVTSAADVGAIAPSVAAALPAIEKQARAVLPTDPASAAGILAHQKPTIDQSIRGATGKETSTIPPYSIDPMATVGKVPIQSTAPIQASAAALPKAGTKADEVAPPIAGAQSQASAQTAAGTEAATKEAPKDEKGEEKDKGGGGMIPWLMGAFGLTAAAAKALSGSLNLGPPTEKTTYRSAMPPAEKGVETGYRGFDPIYKKMLKSGKGTALAGTPEMSAAVHPESGANIPTIDPAPIVPGYSSGSDINKPFLKSFAPSLSGSETKSDRDTYNSQRDIQSTQEKSSRKGQGGLNINIKPESGGVPEDHIHLEPHEKEHIKRKMFENRQHESVDKYVKFITEYDINDNPYVYSDGKPKWSSSSYSDFIKDIPNQPPPGAGYYYHGTQQSGTRGPLEADADKQGWETNNSGLVIPDITHSNPTPSSTIPKPVAPIPTPPIQQPIGHGYGREGFQAAPQPTSSQQPIGYPGSYGNGRVTPAPIRPQQPVQHLDNSWVANHFDPPPPPPAPVSLRPNLDSPRAVPKPVQEEVSQGTRERRKLEIVARSMMTNRRKNKLQARQDAYKKQIIDEDDRVDIMRQAITDAQEKRDMPSKKKVNNTSGKTPVDTHPKLKPEPLGGDIVRN